MNLTNNTNLITGGATDKWRSTSRPKSTLGEALFVHLGSGRTG
jgi:hypothetical protein